jgi:hypothetical protein
VWQIGDTNLPLTVVVDGEKRLPPQSNIADVQKLTDPETDIDWSLQIGFVSVFIRGQFPASSFSAPSPSCRRRRSARPL